MEDRAILVKTYMMYRFWKGDRELGVVGPEE